MIYFVVKNFKFIICNLYNNFLHVIFFVIKKLRLFLKEFNFFFFFIFIIFIFYYYFFFYIYLPPNLCFCLF